MWICKCGYHCHAGNLKCYICNYSALVEAIKLAQQNKNK